MERAHWHTFQVLTKRPERAGSPRAVAEMPWPSQERLARHLSREPALDDPHRRTADDRRRRVRFLSCEPLLGPLDLDLEGIHWVIAGGESGPRARPMRPEWARSIRDQCLAAGVPFFFKQWGYRP